MKRLIPFMILLMIAPFARADEKPASHEGHGRMGSHGMALIGENSLLLYHLSLYEPPHDRQIAIPAGFANRGQRRDFLNWRSGHAGLVTIVPELFDLDRLAPGAKNPIKEFKADIYDGHFERGGVLLFKDVEFELETPIYHQAVTADAAPGERYTYIERGDHAFLIREIGPRPGTDMVLEIALGPDIEPGTRLSAVGGRAEPGYPLRLKDEAGTPVAVLVKTVVYRETADFR